MPSYVIHICLAEEYARKHKVENKAEFIEGTIYPDTIKPQPKGITHYSPYWSSDTNLYEFLLDKKLDSSYNEGYFLHLLADCIFYNRYFPNHRNVERSLLRRDFDRISSKLIQKYKVEQIPEVAKKYVIAEEGETVEYHYDKVVTFIEEVSNYDLHDLAKEILERKDYHFLIKNVKNY